jgi:hypothetical protein
MFSDVCLNGWKNEERHWIESGHLFIVVLTNVLSISIFSHTFLSYSDNSPTYSKIRIQIPYYLLNLSWKYALDTFKIHFMSDPFNSVCHIWIFCFIIPQQDWVVFLCGVWSFTGIQPLVFYEQEMPSSLAFHLQLQTGHRRQTCWFIRNPLLQSVLHQFSCLEQKIIGTQLKT